MIYFKKSSESGPWTNNCVEVAANWFKSSRSTNSAQCVEVNFADPDTAAQVRDSKNPDGPVLSFTKGEWDAFIGGVKNGEFDLA